MSYESPPSPSIDDRPQESYLAQRNALQEGIGNLRDFWIALLRSERKPQRRGRCASWQTWRDLCATGERKAHQRKHQPATEQLDLLLLEVKGVRMHCEHADTEEIWESLRNVRVRYHQLLHMLGCEEFPSGEKVCIVRRGLRGQPPPP